MWSCITGKQTIGYIQTYTQRKLCSISCFFNISYLLFSPKLELEWWIKSWRKFSKLSGFFPLQYTIFIKGNVSSGANRSLHFQEKCFNVSNVIMEWGMHLSQSAAVLSKVQVPKCNLCNILHWTGSKIWFFKQLKCVASL